MSNFRLEKFIISITAIFLLSATLISFCRAQEKEIVIGVVAMLGEQHTSKIWQPTIDYLNRSIPEHHFTLKAIKLNKIENAVKTNSIDFVLTNSGSYVDLEARFGISALATLKTKLNNNTSNQFAGVIFTRSDRDDIQSLPDLRHKSFMGVKEKALGGFQMAWRELKKQGINPFKDFSKLKFAGHPQNKIVYAVLRGEVDAATVRSGVLEHMSDKGLIDITKFKILNKKNDPSFPYLHSTSLYPEWPIAKLKNTSAEIAKSLTISLLELSEKDIAAQKTNSAGWTVPLDYFSVKSLFKDLNLKPYKMTQRTFLEQYWIPTLILLLIVLPLLFIYILKLKITVRAGKEKLARSEIEWSSALDVLDEPMYMVDLEDRIIRANKAFYRHIKSTPENALGEAVINFTHPEGEETPCKVCKARKNLLDTVIVLEPDDPVNKSRIPLEITIKVIRDTDNKPIAILQKMHDLSEVREQEKENQRNERLFSELLDSTPDPLIISNVDGTIVLVNTQFEKQIGYKREEIIGFKIEKLVPSEFISSHIEHRKIFSSKSQQRPMNAVDNLHIVHKDSHLIPVKISLTPFTIDKDKLIITTIHDISSIIEKEKELKRLATFPELNPNPIIEFKKDGEITYANKAATDNFPELYEKNHILFSNINIDINTDNDKCETTRDIDVNGLTFEQKIIYNPETKLYRTYVWDITKIKSLTQEMTYQATHDSLTNLINRREFERRLDKSIKNAKTNHATHSLCYMDLDKFKVVNDTCGHVAGDELLKQISFAINKKIREADTFARLGGDEFALLFEGCSIENAAELAEEIRLEIEKYRFHWDEKTFKIGVSIGIVSIDSISGTAKDIQSAADTACYIAKEKGRNRIHMYSIDSKEITEHTNETNWLTRINIALDNDDFILYFQKIASIENKGDIHYEVLIRMIDTNNNLISPSAFLPAAERFNIMTAVDNWVIKNTLPIMSQNKYKHINFSINLSGQSLGDSKFMNDCIAQISESHIDANRVCFEITETAMIENLNTAIKSVSILRGFGCKVALDDFGSGLSSFAYLKNLPVDYLKIDGSLIKDLDKDTINVTMVNSINHIGHSMGLKTIAEYVENSAVLKILSDMKVDYVQGYGIAKPIPLEEIML